MVDATGPFLLRPLSYFTLLAYSPTPSPCQRGTVFALIVAGASDQPGSEGTYKRGTRSWEFSRGIVLGLIAGFIASRLMGGGGYGIIGDIIVGIVGALIGGFVFGLITGNPNPVNNIDVGSIIVAIVGACILIAILRAVSGNRVRS